MKVIFKFLEWAEWTAKVLIVLFWIFGSPLALFLAVLLAVRCAS